MVSNYGSWKKHPRSFDAGEYVTLEWFDCSQPSTTGTRRQHPARIRTTDIDTKVWKAAMLRKISITMAIAAVLMVLSAPQADARFGCRIYGGGLRYQQVRVFFGQPFYGRRICGGVYYGGCWRWQYTWWGWQLTPVCGVGYGYPLAYP